jgi:hypothetical protein
MNEENLTATAIEAPTQENAAPAPVAPPPALLYRLIERDGTIWQLGRPWPAPKAAQGDEQIGRVECVVSAILYVTTEDDADGDEVEVAPYYQVVGLPMAKGKMRERNLGVTTDVALEDVKRAEGLQDAQVLAAYMTEMVRGGQPQQAAQPSE